MLNVPDPILLPALPEQQVTQLPQPVAGGIVVPRPANPAPPSDQPAAVFVSLWVRRDTLHAEPEISATVHRTRAAAAEELADIVDETDGGTRGDECTAELPLRADANARTLDLTEDAQEILD